MPGPEELVAATAFKLVGRGITRLLRGGRTAGAATRRAGTAAVRASGAPTPQGGPVIRLGGPEGNVASARLGRLLSRPGGAINDVRAGAARVPVQHSTIRPTGGTRGEVPRGGTYLLRDPATGQVARTGRSNDLARRAGEHARDPHTRDLQFEPVHRTDNRSQQRGLEQLLHDQYNAPLDRINPISPRNPMLQKYLDAADEFLQGGGG